MSGYSQVLDGCILFIIALINTKLEDLVKLAEVF